MDVVYCLPPGPMPVSQLTLVPSVFGGSFFDKAFLHAPVSIVHPFAIFKMFFNTPFRYLYGCNVLYAYMFCFTVLVCMVQHVFWTNHL